MSDVSEFLARQPVRKGKLAPWQNDIVALRRAGATYRSVCIYLAEHGVTARPEEVRRYLARCGRQQLVATDAPAVRSPMPKTTALNVADAKPTERKSPGTSLPKFDWAPGKPKTPW